MRPLSLFVNISNFINQKNIIKMKENTKKYVSPCVEAMKCEVEQGFQCSGERCDGAMLENIHESSSNPDASFN